MTPDTPLRLAVFDLDGTIVDSQGAIIEAMHQASALHGFPAPGPAAVRHVVGLPLIEAVARLFPDLDGPSHEELTESYKNAIIAMRQAGTISEPLFPGARDAIHAIDADGWLLGIATGKPHRGLVNTLEPHGLLDRFITLQTADRAPGKPSPEMLFRAMGESGVDAGRTVMIGDTSYDMEMAANAGVMAIGVAWGYHDREGLLASGASHIVETYDELVIVLRELGGLV
ncbi:MAG: HAD-IA family hydrolase [Rhodospirillales bacterium]|nr:HAD-IA family hydrolase [Rhodospirillales bacterium]MCW8861580.1 HAD-IA family hydrolase [Rhodospirillales bacterium]MCW8951585.1 HAD-IA family hydrolase [Rhodospirillales bacterium]MCW8970735.1 HAD-IA family hydrolase [Rhodospirillales bacterium]MCW9003102.1 HAD-IA family hydrolase [Rhodospirillales bacterium]